MTQENSAGWLRRFASGRIMAGITTRAAGEPAARSSVATVAVEQVHGGSLAIVGPAAIDPCVIAGCDALLSRIPQQLLTVRTADCVPIFFADADRHVIGIAHAGWRGLLARLPMRMVAAFCQSFSSHASRLRVAIGPAIRVCCYEVGPEFLSRFGACVARQSGRWMCDLIGVATAQLRQAGVAAHHIIDSEHCTGCEPDQWYSVRREGQSTGRMTSWIMLKP